MYGVNDGTTYEGTQVVRKLDDFAKSFIKNP